MSLEDLRKKIYNPEENFNERTKKPESFQVEEKPQKKKAERWVSYKKPKKKLPKKTKKKLFIIGSILAAFVLIGSGFAVWYGMNSFDKDKVDLTIEGPKRVVSGDEVRYIVKYENNARLKLENVKLIFHYPSDSVVSGNQDLVQSFELPDLNAKQNSKIELPVRIIGLKGETKEAWAELNYNPEGISSKFTNEAKFQTNIFSVPLAVSFSLPSELVNDQQFDFSLHYSNRSEVSFEDLWVKMDYPEGFEFESSSPLPEEDNKIWELGELVSKKEGRVIIRGKIKGSKGEVKQFKAMIGRKNNGEFVPIAETINSFQISSSPLAISQTLNGSTDYIAKSGSTLNYKINYQNTTDVSIKDVVISSKLEGEVLDFASFDSENGFLEQENKTVIWKASSLSELEYLEPNEKGEVEFSVKVKDSLPIENFTDRNFMIYNKTQIDSSNVPLALKDIEIKGVDELATKVASDLNISAQAYYNDDVLNGSGPIPPEVGKKTVYTLKWRLLNSSNDLSSVKVESSLPSGVNWENEVFPSSADIKYNEASGKLVWNVGELSAGTGVLSPVKEISFQVSITPNSSQVGEFVKLLNTTKVTGYDNFIEKEINNSDNYLSTLLEDDSSVQKGEVVE